MKSPIAGKIARTLKITGIGLFTLVVLLFLAPYFFPETISNKIKGLAKNNLKGELNFSKARFSFFSHFPSLTLNLENLVLKGSEPFHQDTLVSAKELALGVDLFSLFSRTIHINQIFLTEGLINIEVNAKGEPNYNVYVAQPAKNSNAADTGSASLKIERIVIEKTHFVYDDRSLPMIIDAGGFEYEGKGDFSKSIFDLSSRLSVHSIDFEYGNRNYFVSKTINAKLVTRINTHSLEFLFEKNDLRINQLPLDFTGRFAFLKDGYDMDFNIHSNQTELKNLVTAFPPEYLKWLDKTEIKGMLNLKASLAGKYSTASNSMPGFNMNMDIRNGYIANSKTAAPVENLFLNFETKFPGFNMDSLTIKIDSLYASIGKDYLSSALSVKGINRPEIHAKINAEADLQKWQQALGLPGLEARGHLSVHGQADGIFSKDQNPKKIRPDTIISSIPAFHFTASFGDGYFKYPSLPKAVEQVRFVAEANCPGHDYKKSSVQITGINATLGSNYLKGMMKLSGADDFPMEINLKGLLDLSNIQQFYPLDSMDLKGNITMDINSKGKYNPAKKMFPVTKAVFLMNNGFVKTKYYPHPIEQIKVDASLLSTGNSIKDVSFDIKPIGLSFEGQAFTVSAHFNNFDNIQYNIVSKGTIDIGKVYQVFARKGMDVQGLVKTDVHVKGSQNDAMAGRYDRLSNNGSMTVKDLLLRTDYYPHPFLVQSGLFRFKEDKLVFESFNGKYLGTDFSMNGSLNNLINYIVKDQPLQGQFTVKSNRLIADDWMAFAGDTSQATVQSGVFMVPANLSLNLKAAINQVNYQGIKITDAKTEMILDKGLLTLKETGFTLIGAPVVMDATYQALNPKRAAFNYHITAKEFDIKKAYREIKLFHDMATAAAGAEGIVSLDYQLKGKLDAAMHPVYPSLEGGGILSVKAVKLKGFKMFSAAGKAAGKDSLTGNADLTKVDIKTTIKNNIITLEQTKLRVPPFRLKMSGQVSFDGNMNIRFRLGLPPLGIFGIPMNITGTQANPKVKLGRGDKNQALTETQDTEEQ